MWHLGTWFSSGLGSAGSMVRLDLKGLSSLNDSMILWLLCLAGPVANPIKSDD